jgi:flagellar biosynthesis regulator FlaF
MSITDRQRLKLLRTLETVIGPEDASTLMDHLPPVTWANVATVDHVSAIGDQTTKTLRSEMQVLSTQLRSEMNELRVELRSDMTVLSNQLRNEMNQLGTELRSEMNRLGIELRSEMNEFGIQLRSEIDQHGSRLEATIERGFRRQILALVTLGTTWFAITAAILQLTR